MTEPIFIVVDLFCGAGGTTTGFAQAEFENKKLVKVIACVNHDHKAITSHWANHPEVKHFEEDIRTLDLTELIDVVKFQRSLYPSAKLILWASLECTNFSKAKGGQPRDADSRTLADHLERYILAIDPDYVQIENVVEFMSWGPLDDKGKPVSKKNGTEWMRWRKEICDMGYRDEWKELNSANFGAYTSRNRLFGVFAKDNLPITWPEPTHAKNPSKMSMYGDLKKWMPVKDVLNFTDEGESIFTRKKPLSDKTLERIYAGLIKYVAKGDKSFISKYYSGKPSGKNISVNGPAGTVTCVDGQALVQPQFLLKYNSTDKTGQHYPPSVNEPCPVVTTQNRLGLVQPEFLTHYYGQGGQLSSIENPAPVIPTKARTALVQPKFILNYNHSSATNDINEPSPAIVAADKLGVVQPKYFIVDPQWSTRNGIAAKDIEAPCQTLLASASPPYLVQASPFIMPTNFDNQPKSIDEPCPTVTASRKHHYIVNPSHGGNNTSTDNPCPVIVARQDKAPLYLVQCEKGSIAIAVYENDSEISIKIKEFMVIFELIDIKMRMLRVGELLQIQGFPSEYVLEGNQSDQKKFIGNSVVPKVVKVWAESMAIKLFDYLKKKAA